MPLRTGLGAIGVASATATLTTRPAPFSSCSLTRRVSSFSARVAYRSVAMVSSA